MTHEQVLSFSFFYDINFISFILLTTRLYVLTSINDIVHTIVHIIDTTKLIIIIIFGVYRISVSYTDNTRAHTTRQYICKEGSSSSSSYFYSFFHLYFIFRTVSLCNIHTCIQYIHT